MGQLDSDAEPFNYPEVRHQLAVLARRRQARITAFSHEVPTKWNVYQVRNPETELPFTDESAWEFIAQLLEQGHPLIATQLRKPPNAIGYEMLVVLEDKRPKLYVKLQLGAGRVIGRSFHYSEK
jgi:hypothetical protein